MPQPLNRWFARLPFVGKLWSTPITLRGLGRGEPEPARPNGAAQQASVMAQLQQLIREQERIETRLHLLAAHAPCLIWHGSVIRHYDPEPWWDWRIGVLDEAAAQNFVPLDMLPGEGYSHAWWRHRVLDDRQHVDRIAQRALADKQSYYEVEFRCRQRDGAIRWFTEQVFVEVGDERTRHLIGVATDITDRKQIEVALRASEERFRATFEQAAVGIAHVSVDGRWLMANQRLCAVVCYTRDELMSTSFQSITYAEDCEPSRTSIRRMLAGEIETYSLEKRYIRKDGQLTWVDETVSLVRDGLGQPEYFIAVVEDINERKQLAAQLLQMQKLDSIGRLAGGIAHDFNNLLTVMIGHIALMRDYLPADAPLQNDLAAVDGAASRAAMLTHQLLAFARKQVLAPRVLVLNNLIHDLDQLLRRLIGEHIELQTDLAADLGRVRVDPGQIEQVLINLALNARDAMPQGGRLTISTRNVLLDSDYARGDMNAQPGPHVLLAVSDTGAGIPPEIQAQIFEPFFTTKESGQGTGLGLATSYGIIKQHGGNIWVSSQVDAGARFEIFLPQVDEPAEAQPADAIETRLPTGTETVLLVEDDEAVRALAARVLRALGYTILTAANGLDALQALTQYPIPIQLALIDMIMPEMSGKQLSEHLKRRDPSIKVLFMSGYTDAAIEQHAQFDAGMPLLQKPFSPATLAQKVHAVLHA